ncbi:MAG: DNA-directed RNA polymerase subunit alpha C-terminal domain-containing protein [Ardenticatenaceae bacterium]
MTKDQNTLDPQIAALPLTVLKLPIRPLKVLQKQNIQTIGQLAGFSELDLLELNNFGSKSVEELRQALAHMGLEYLLSGSTIQTRQTTKATVFSVFQITDFPSEFVSVSIRVLRLSTRHQNALERSGIWTLGDLGEAELSRIRQIRSIGQKAIINIKHTLSNLDFTLLRAKVAGKSPDTLVQLSLALTSLPEQIKTILNRANIKNVASVIPLTSNQLRRLGLSADHIDTITKELTAHFLIPASATPSTESKAEVIDEPEPSPEPELKLTAFLSDDLVQLLSPIERVQRMLAQLTDRQSQVLRWRYRLDNNEPITLEEAGQKLGITRERVRQIQKRASKKLQLPFHRRIMEPLITCLEAALEKKHGLLSLEESQEVLCAQGEYQPISAQSLLEFVLLIAGHRVEQLKKPPFITLNHPPYNSYHYHLPEILSLFDQILTDTRAPLPENEMQEQFLAQEKGELIASEVPGEYLKVCLDLHPKIEINQDGEYALKRWQNRVVDDIIVVLRKHGKPLHYKEITKRVNERVSEEQQSIPRNIHAKLGHYPDIFVRVGHGIFGLADWGLQQDRTLAEASMRVLREGGPVLSIEEITDRVLETWLVKRTSVQAAIHLEPRIIRVGHHLYSLADPPQENEQESEEASSSEAS